MVHLFGKVSNSHKIGVEDINVLWAFQTHI